MVRPVTVDKIGWSLRQIHKNLLEKTGISAIVKDGNSIHTA